MIYFGSQNDPENWASEANIQRTSKVAQIDMYTTTDAKPAENVWENVQRPEFLLIL